MFGKLVSAAVNTATLPARMTIRGGVNALNAVRTLPDNFDHLTTDFRLAQQEANQLVQQLLSGIDTSFDRDIADMTLNERESTAMVELEKAERHLSEAMFSLLKVLRLATAEPSRIIEHEAPAKPLFSRKG